ncbi:lyase family protein [Shigella flexneri]
MNGAVGNYNADIAAYPKSTASVQRVVRHLAGYSAEPVHHPDSTARLHRRIVRLRCALQHHSDRLDRDVWGYIALNHFKQKTIAGEIGSSTMPHKLNPIDFENSEGNLGLSNARALQHLARQTAGFPLAA